MHSLAALADGSAWAWGRNAEGQLGDGTTSASATPVRVVGLDAVGPQASLDVTIDSPQQDAAIDASEGWFTISGTATGGSADLSDATVLADGEVVYSEPLWEATGSEWAITVAPPAPGDYTLQVVITDADGVSGSDTVDVTVTGVLEPAPVSPARVRPSTRTSRPSGVASLTSADVFLQAEFSLGGEPQPQMQAMAGDPTFEHFLLDLTFDDTYSVKDEDHNVTLSFSTKGSHLESCIGATFRLRIQRPRGWSLRGAVELFENSVEASNDLRFEGTLSGKFDS